MIGYFVKSGDPDVGRVFNPYRFSFSTILNAGLLGKKYSKDLELILIEYHLEGKFLDLPDEEYKVKSYRKKERSIAVVVGVSQKFLKWSEIEKKKFFVTSTLGAINAVKNILSKKTGFNLESIERIYSDVEECSKLFLK